MMPGLLGSPLFLRMLATLAVITAGLLLYRLVSYLTLRRAGMHSPGFERASHGKPVLLYFTTPTCTPCKTIQRPAIRRLQELAGGQVEVVEIDASARPDLATQWGVLSVPTTFLIDANGKPRHVNYGVTGTEKLLDQLNELV